jgi:hypothetical protein
MVKISAALVKAQKEFGPALKTHTNPAFRSKYADLSACVEAVVDAFNNNGIFLMQLTHDCNDGVIVETVFIHESGEQLSSGKLHVPAAKHDAQGYGSALTYARRYSLMAACGIAPEDDDANAASKPPTVKQAAPAPPPTPAPAAPPKLPAKIAGKDVPWQLVITTNPDNNAEVWAHTVTDATVMALDIATSEADVMSIFKVNRNVFDELKKLAPTFYDDMMNEFKKAKLRFRKEEVQE